MTQYKVLMPKLSLTMTEGTVVKWYKRVGDAVTKGEPLLEVMTDKVNMEVESPFTGVIKEILIPEGESVEVIKPIGVIEGEPGQEDFGMLEEEQETVPEKEAGPEHKLVFQKHEEVRIKASPAAKAYAIEHNIDLRKIKGTGPGGRIILENVESYAKGLPSITPVAKKIAEANNIDITSINTKKKLYKQDIIKMMENKHLGAEGEALSGIRKTMARRMTESWTQIPHVTLNMDVDMTVAMRFKNSVSNEFQQKVSYTDIFIKAASMALEVFPLINSSLVDGKIIEHKDINIGIATDTPQGLIVPVIHQTQSKTLLEISGEAKQLIEKARTGRLTASEITGGTFTITNLGMFGIDSFTPIINPPEAAILGINRLKQAPVLNGQKLEFVPVVTLSLSFDHRLIDGATGARFLNKVKYFIENPYFINIGHK